MRVLPPHTYSVGAMYQRARQRSAPNVDALNHQLQVVHDLLHERRLPFGRCTNISSLCEQQQEQQ